MSKIYVIPNYIDWLIQNETQIQQFVKRLNEINVFLSNQKIHWNCKIFIDFCKVQEYDDFGLYNIKMFSSLFLDSCSFFHIPAYPKNYNFYSYYIVPNLAIETPKETKEIINISLSHENNIDLYVLTPDLNKHSLLKVHNFDNTIHPTLVTHNPIELNNLEIDLFLKNYVMNYIEDTSEYIDFRNAYFSFYNSFDWENWIPTLNPVPGHEILKRLAKHYKKPIDDSGHLKWGYITASINGGKFNRELTKFNSKKKVVNDVFQLGISKGKNTLFYSIDTEQGNLEIYDYKGKHINKVYGLVTGLKTEIRPYTIEVPQHKWFY